MNSILKTRRRFLHLTASCGLLAPFFDQVQSLAATDKAQRRVAFVFFPHGSPSSSGYFPGMGPLGTLNGVLAPIAQHKDKMLIVGGLGAGLEGGYGHSGGNTAVLTGRGSGTKVDGFYIPKAASADWLIARYLKQEPLVLGVNAPSGFRFLVSWSEATKAGMTNPVNDVAEAFKRVYGRAPTAGTCTPSGGLTVPTTPGGGTPTTTTSPLKGNVLDVIAADLNSLKSALPSWARTTLDDQLDAVSDLQKAAKAAPVATTPPPATTPPATTTAGTSEGCYAAGSSDFYQKSNYMSDLIVAAFQGGSRRVATIQQGTASGDSFKVPGYGEYHSEVHDLNGNGNGDAARVTKMQTEIFKDIGYLLDRLTATKDMSGSALIESTLVYICTEFGVYGAADDPHNTASDLAMVLVGAKDTFATTGQCIKTKGGAGNLLVHAAQYMGLSKGAGLSADDIGMFDPLAGVLR